VGPVGTRGGKALGCPVIVGGWRYPQTMSVNVNSDGAAALLTLLHGAPELRATPTELRLQFEAGRSPEEVLELPDPSQILAEDRSDELAAASTQIEEWSSNGIQVLTPFSGTYPMQLRTVFDYPLFLFARGHVKHDPRSVAIVGSRDVTSRGLAFASALARRLAGAGVTIVSGLARGVDGAAHEAALRAGGRTVSVLGNGLNRVYPSEHRELQEIIAESGLLISQFLPNETPTKRSFPARNVTMSAYSSITAIVEAAERSGTRIQADAAIKHGRPLIISEQVAETTTWGARYAAGSFDVTVVPSPDAAADAALGILERIESPAVALAG